MPDLVAIDIETTGWEAGADRLLEIGAVRFTLDGNLAERFVTFVATDRPVPAVITDLTGIRDEDLVGAPLPADAIERLRAFLGEAWAVGHNVGFDLGFLRAAGLSPPVAWLDTAELASCLAPTASSYALGRLIAHLERPEARAHRALDDAEAAALLCAELARAARSLRIDTLDGAVALAERMDAAFHWFFAEALAAKARATFEESVPAAPVETLSAGGGPPVPDRGPDGPRRDAPEAPASAGAASLATAPLAELFSASGPLASRFEGYEERPEQLEMAEAVEGAMRDGGALVVEAGTGAGKSLAYLVPASRAARAGRRVVVSTYTTTLQDQLARKDLPQLDGALGLDLRVAVLKGRANYLCPRRWHLLRLTAATRDELRLALKILVWRESTTSGDRAELNLLGGEQPLWSRVCAEDETCTTRRCAAVRGGCYLERAREAAERAHLVVVNHALLLADARSRNRLLPEASIAVIDEAHHLEEVAAQQFGLRLEVGEIRRSVDRLARAASALAALAPEVVEELRAEAERAHAANGETFAALAALMPPPEARGYEDRRRVTAGLRATEEWLAVELAGERLADALAALSHHGERLAAQTLSEPDASAECAAAAAEVRGYALAVERLVHAPRATDVCWLTLEPAVEQPVLQSAPSHAGGVIARTVTAPRHAVVFTSATLAVGGTFDFAVERFGLGDRAATLLVGSPFDYRRQALLALPQGLVDPYDAGFVDQVADVVAELGRALGGKTLVLFTAHTMLRAVHERVAMRLEPSDIRALAQAASGSRRQILERFVAGRAVLLGTAAFWEGVDLPGDLLRCVVIVKLPFPVPDDPLVEGRAERYEDPFRQYHLPVAALRLKQGFGRLIRTRDDRGAVVLLDRRVGLRAYGEVLLASLPECTVGYPDVAAVATEVARWCDEKG